MAQTDKTRLRDGGSIVFAPDAVYIYDPCDDEIVMWQRDEWVEDPEAGTAALNAILVAVTHGTKTLKSILNHKTTLEKVWAKE